MKHYLINMLCICLLSKCKEVNNDPVRVFIPGTYVMAYSNEYSIGSDTLTITALNNHGSNYQVARNTTYQRIREGKSFPKENKQETWLCLYNEQSHVLNEMKAGKIILFIPERKALLIGDNEYQKVE